MDPHSSTRKSYLRQGLLWGLRTLLPRRRLLVRERADSNSVYLTFDDGPTPGVTPLILDVLRRHGVRATFFVIGQRAAAQPQLLRQIADDGHAIGGHSYLHRAANETSCREFMDEVWRTDAALRDVVGRTSRLVRPPLGKLTACALARLLLDGRTVVLWNKDPRDYAAADVASLEASLQADPPAAGDIILLHDTSPVTPQVLDGLIARVKEAGLRFAAIGAGHCGV